MPKQSAKQTDPVHIKELKPDDKNLRAHNPRNIGMIADAMQEVGAARSIVIDEDGTILAGNGAVEAAGQAGITKVKVVDVDGETIVAVRRKGLTARQKKRLAAYDNRTSELAAWNTDEVQKILADDAKALEGMFESSELSIIQPGKIISRTIEPLPKLGWALIGIEITQFGKVQAMLDKLPKTAIIKTTIQ